MMQRIVRTLIVGGVFVVGIAVGRWSDSPAIAAQATPTVFELRTYTTAPGKLDDLHARFRDHTLDLFQKHGMVNIGYWKPMDEPLKDNTLIYIVAHKSREAADASWKAFSADPEWQKAKAASEVGGTLVTKVDRVWMTAADYSAIK